MTDPFKQHAALIKAARDAQRLVAPTERIAEELARSSNALALHRSGVAEAMAQIQKSRNLLTSALGVEAVFAKLNASRELAKQLTADIRPVLSLISSQADVWKSLLEPIQQRASDLQAARALLPDIASSFRAWELTARLMTSNLRGVGLLERNGALAERLLAPSDAFTHFAAATIDRLRQSTDSRQTLALEASLSLAEEQLISTSSSVGAIAVVPEDEQEVSQILQLRAPYVQQEEMLSLTEQNTDADEADVINASPAANVAAVARAILSTITACNEARKISGGEEIFKPTTRLLETYADLPWLVAIDKGSFAGVVDCVYFLFYEGAGKDNLRFLKKNGGPIEDDDFQFIGCIKHLRNKWTRHDADHGADKDIEKSWKQLSEAIRWLGLGHLPVTADDFRLLQANLLAKAQEFIDKILRGVVQ